MKLWAISDLHLACPPNRQALEKLRPHPGDWLAIAGDVGETQGHLNYALSTLVPRFDKVIWVPCNHDLWSIRDPDGDLRGEAKYRRLVEICHSHGVLTPEDPYPTWPHLGPAGETLFVAPLFLLYDYSFRPSHVGADEAVDWAAEVGLRCSDEDALFPDPFPSRQAWCQDRLRYTEARLQSATAQGARPILINHFPLNVENLLFGRLLRFSIWCGTRQTMDWHQKFDALAVVYGHLHINRTHFRDGVRFEEVSLGYPRQWNQNRPLESYLRQILPVP